MRHEDFGMQVYTTLQGMKGYARKLAGVEADDLIHDTVVKALRYKSTFQQDTNIVAWLTTIMRNVFYSDVKKASYRRTFPMDDAVNEIAHPYTHRSAEDRIELMQRLSTLPPSGLAIVADVAVGPYTYATAARKYGVCAETIKSRVLRTRRGEYRAGGPRKKRAVNVGN